MALDAYRRKRDFRKTSEPAGRKRPRRNANLRFVIQKHAATRLHYDLRLELDGVLKSWALPKGPSLDPAEKRLAVHVEDHPLEYGTFEGSIPHGEYGAGEVIVWDRGWWEPEGDPDASYLRGKLEFVLHGEKLKGRWVLVRMHSPRNEDGRGKKDNWLLIKARDGAARARGEPAIVDERPDSVASGRAVEDVAGADGAKDGNHTAKRKSRTATLIAERSTRQRNEARARHNGTGRRRVEPASIEGVKKSALPTTIRPQLATLVEETPNGRDWIHEIKFDGYRILCRIDRSGVILLTRNGHDWTDRFPSIAKAARDLPLKQALLDGELVVIHANGRTNFQELQNAMRTGRTEDLVFCAFDLLHLDGFDLRGAPLEARKEALATLLESAPRSIRYSAHTEKGGREIFQEACRLALEGIVSKRRDRPYLSGRSGDWLKVRCGQRQEFVIGAYTDPRGSRVGLGALLIGVYDGQARLQYAGKVGTGFDRRTLANIHRRLKALETRTPPFANAPPAGFGRGTHWVRPVLVAEVRFTEWTKDAMLRHPSFLGIRDDKGAREVVREAPQPMSPTVAAKNRVRSVAAPSRMPGVSKIEKATADRDAIVAGIPITNPDRVLYPEGKITKLELARYYEKIAEWILPHIADRPLSLVRCPQGRDKHCFYQKHFGDRLPKGVHGLTMQESDHKTTYPTIDSVAGLASLVQLGVLEIHPWGARAKDLDRPDRMILDLDPGPGTTWADVVEAAKRVHEYLDRIGLRSFPKTTGGKGLHVVVPLTGRQGWTEVREFARDFAEAMARESPSRYTARMSKSHRTGRIFIDWLRNARGATAVATYSTRARPGAPVSTPVRWSELRSNLRSDAFTIRNLPRRLAVLKKDPWQGFATTHQSLPVVTSPTIRRFRDERT
ncbi:MAG: DNA ligase D [Planctomycetes bacterium]|nr:DNA ligase D [Planctomycetota bacterium]MBI3844821.1 DNA ligase D [Planctomycetota bacterium]